MENSFYQFIVDNFTLSVFVSVIVYKIFSSLLDDIITPILLNIIDPHHSLSQVKFELGDYSIEYGKSFRDGFVSFVILFTIYFVSSTMK
jgi:large-conductance mechanosensitive channel